MKFWLDLLLVMWAMGLNALGPDVVCRHGRPGLPTIG
jgi:hypothetical protein